MTPRQVDELTAVELDAMTRYAIREQRAQRRANRKR